MEGVRSVAKDVGYTGYTGNMSVIFRTDETWDISPGPHGVVRLKTGEKFFSVSYTEIIDYLLENPWCFIKDAAIKCAERIDSEKNSEQSGA